ncbi:MAG: DUF1684 domain-containing protein [Mucilaginibacter sp.]
MIKRLFMVVLLMTAFNCFAQDYKTLIAEYRKSYTEDFLKDPSSPLKKDDLQFLRFYDADSTYMVTAKVTVFENEPAFVMPVFKGTGRQYVRYALLKFTLRGKPMELTLYKDALPSPNPQYADYIFLPFTDKTNGLDTYGGGRYIDLTKSDIKDGNVVIDFNKAYNPYCAFSEGYSCPKPPDANRLTVAIEAGEKLFAGQKKH